MLRKEEHLKKTSPFMLRSDEDFKKVPLVC